MPLKCLVSILGGRYLGPGLSGVLNLYSRAFLFIFNMFSFFTEL